MAEGPSSGEIDDPGSLARPLPRTSGPIMEIDECIMGRSELQGFYRVWLGRSNDDTDFSWSILPCDHNTSVLHLVRNGRNQDVSKAKQISESWRLLLYRLSFTGCCGGFPQYPQFPAANSANPDDVFRLLCKQFADAPCRKQSKISHLTAVESQLVSVNEWPCLNTGRS